MDKKIISIGLLATGINKKYRDQIKACNETWIQTAKKYDVPVYFFAGYKVINQPNIINFPEVEEDYNSSMLKQFNGLKWLLDNSPSEFYMFGGSDNYINIQNLLNLLSNYSSSDELYIGGHGTTRNIFNKDIYFHSGGGGFILSHALLKKLYEKYTPKLISDIWIDVCKKNNTLNLMPACDVTIAYLFDGMNINPTKVANMSGCDFRGRCNISSTKCCDNIEYKNIISCHFVDPYQMKAVHEIYQFDQSDNTKLYNEINPKWTLVTCLYDMKKYDNEPGKGLDHYIRNSETLFSLNINLIIYCNQEIADKILDIRKKYNFESQTIIRDISLTEMPLYKFKDKITHNRKHIKKCADPRNTVTYFIIVGSKHTMLKNEISLNPFQSQYFGWIDIGIGNTTSFTPFSLYNALSLYRDKVSQAYIDYTPEGIMRNNDVYYQYGRCGTACGFITGRSDYLTKVCELYEKKLFETIESGYGHAEEQIIPLINLDHPELFEFYYGDYSDLMTNYGKYKFNPQITLNLLIPKLLSDRKHLMCYQACKNLLTAYEEENTFFEFVEWIKLTQNYYTSMYYLGKFDECIELFKKYNTYHAYEKFEDFFNVQINYIMNNTDFIFNHLGVKAIRIDTDNLNDSRINEYIKLGYKVFVYGKYPNTVKSLVYQNPIIRNIGFVLNIHYEKHLINTSDLKSHYLKNCSIVSDIYEHLPTLYKLSTICQSVVELGVRKIVSSWAFLYGLSCNSTSMNKSLIMCDLNHADCNEIFRIAQGHGIRCTFQACNDLNLKLDENVDMTFIDTWHIYGHLKRELAKFHLLTNKFIVMHDTTVDAIYGESIRAGWDIDKNAADSGYAKEEITKGLWPAIEEFLLNNEDWQLVHRYTNNNGLTVLARKAYLNEAKSILFFTQ